MNSMHVQYATGPADSLRLEQLHGRVNLHAAGGPIEFGAYCGISMDRCCRYATLPLGPGADVCEEPDDFGRRRGNDDLCDCLDGGIFLDQSLSRESVSIGL